MRRDGVSWMTRRSQSGGGCSAFALNRVRSPAKAGAQSRNARLLATARCYVRHRHWAPAFAGEAHVDRRALLTRNDPRRRQYIERIRRQSQRFAQRIPRIGPGARRRVIVPGGGSGQFGREADNPQRRAVLPVHRPDAGALHDMRVANDFGHALHLAGRKLGGFPQLPPPSLLGPGLRRGSASR